MKQDVETLYDRRADQRWERISVGDIFERMRWSQPDKLALIAAPCAIRDPRLAQLTYRQADEAVNAIAHGLLSHGLQRGARVALFCDNSNEAFLCKFACAKAGLVAVPINTMMAADMVEHSLRHVGASAAIVDAEAWSRARIAIEAAGVPVLAAIVDRDGQTGGLPSLAELMHGQPTTEPEVRIHGDDIWEILMTSGTTAMPKAVMISHTYTYLAGLNQASAYSRGLSFESDYRLCTFLPAIYHIGDQIFPMSAWLAGGSVVLGRTPTAANLCATIAAQRPSTLFVGSPQFLADLVRAADAQDPAPDLGSLRIVVYGWGAVDPAVRTRLQRLSPQAHLVGIFGQTECVALHRFPVEQYPEVYQQTAPATNVVGLPTPLLASTVMDEDGRSLHEQPGARGEVVYRSPIMTAGYFRDEEATSKAFRYGWFHSGDVCEFREDGLRVMVDRHKDIIKSGGENVSSLRVEAVVAQFPSVSRVAVVGLPDARWGERVTAVVVPRSGELLNETALLAFCRERLAGFETPKQVVLVEELPATVGGKVLKYKLRQMLAAS